MLKKFLLPLLFLAATASAVAQTSCAPPVLKVFCNGEEIPATGGPMARVVRLQVTPDADCPEPVSYQVSNAQVTLIRRGRPVLPSLSVKQPTVDLRAWVSVCQPGDHINVFIPYQNLTMVAANGARRPYLPPAAKPSQPLDIRTDAAKGISFNWVVVAH